MQISIQKSKGQTFVQFKLADVISVFALMLISFVTIDTVQAQGFSQDQRRAIIQSLSDEEQQDKASGGYDLVLLPAIDL